MSLLVISGAAVRLGGRTILDGADLTVDQGRRIGLVGRNGAGKSTLLRAIAGEQPLDGGDIRLAARARIATVAQEAPSGDASPAGHRAAGRPGTPRPAGRGRHRRTPSPRRDPRTPAHHRRRCGPGPRRRHPRRPRLRRGRPAAPGGGVLRRLAHARGAGHRAVRRPRPAAARRTDQPPRPGSHAVAGDLARPLPRRRAAGLARPRPAGPRGAGDRLPRPRHASPSPPAASTNSSASAPSARCSRPARPNASPPNARISSRSSTASATRRARRARRSRASRRSPACRRSRR